jgi:predicted dehydrogenase
MPIRHHLQGRAEVRWGIIGCGDVTEVKSGPGFQKAAGSRLVAVMRRNGALAADYARRHQVPKWYDDAGALIGDPEVDAIYIATPPDSHASYALQAAAAGKPAYVEKPMARHAPECDRMVAAFQQADLPLYVAYYRRRLPRCLAAEELLRSAIGTLTAIQYRYGAPKHLAGPEWRIDAATAGGGLFLDLGSHELDLIDYLTGPLQHVSGQAVHLASRHELEDGVQLTFRNPAGVPGVASWNFASAIEEDLMVLAGTEGRISFSVFGADPVRLERKSGVEVFDRPNPPHVAQPLIQSVVGDLLGREVCPSTGESARRTSRVMDLALAGYYGGREDAFWSRPASWPGRPRRD